MRKLFFRYVWGIMIVGVALLIASCNGITEPTPEPTPEPVGPVIGKGLFVANEGNYMISNASLSFYDTKVDTVMNNLFYHANEKPLGDVAQSLALSDGKLFIVVNNSKYIYKVNAVTQKYEAQMTGFYSPRNMMFLAPDKAYVSDLVGTDMWIVNPVTMTHTGTIAMGKTTENMVRVGDEVYVTNWSNYYQPETENNTVQVIDIRKDSLIAEVEVGKEPNSIVVDRNNNIWVLSSGGYINPVAPKLCCIDPVTKQVVESFTFTATYPDCYPSNLKINASGERLYFVDSGIYSMLITDTKLPDHPLIEKSEGSVYYNVAVDPKDGDLYVTDAKSYVVDGELLRYSSDGALRHSETVGIIPGFMLFNY
ncbi:MAG: YncE family protein [Candidatus Limimorpha sp.]